MLLLGWLAMAPAARAQEPDLVIRPGDGLDGLARRAARMLARRTGTEVLVGDAPPPALVEAVPRGHVGMVVRDGVLVIVLGGDGGVSYATELEMPRRNDVASARAVALAIESLRDTAAEGPPSGPEGATGPARRWVHAWRFEGDLFPHRDIEPIATPTLFLRFLVGVSPVRGTLLFGPGAGLGLCVTAHCVVLEGDLPLAVERRRAAPDATVRYRAVNFSVRFQYRPFEFGPFTPGLTFGFMTRIGTATIEETDSSKVATNLGVRGTLEIAWEFVDRFELVLEGGLDVAISRAEFIRDSGERLLLEDRLTPWAVLSARLRP